MNSFQSNTNWLPIESNINWLPIAYQLTANWMSISKDSSRPMAPRSFPSIEGNTRGAKGWDEFIPMECQLMSKMLDWHSFRILRVTPLKIFRGSSRPMRSQHSKLSTNEKPRFWPKSQCLQNLESSNLMPICQLTVIPIYWQPKGYQLNVNQ